MIPATARVSIAIIWRVNSQDFRDTEQMSDSFMKYEYSCLCGGIFFNPSKGENAKRNKE